MYDGCFGLKRRPFVSVPQIDHYFPATTIENARTTLARCIQRGEGPALVIGPSGTGKTLLCLLLAEQFRRSFEVVMLASGRLSTRRALFQAILYELGRPYRGLDESEARLAVVDYLMTGDSGLRGILLLVDEAHVLPLRLLEEIRLLSNLTRDGQPLVRLVLVGGPPLEERFASPKLDSFSQRLCARCYLEALNRSETEEYVQSQINTVGGRGDEAFSQESCQSVYQATGGVPRLINQLCDHALLLAYVAGRQQIEPAEVEEAWSDLQQLPTPWSAEPKAADSTGGVVEFGSLDDQAETAPAAPTAAQAATPTLWIASTEEEQESEPSEQIHRIEQLLAEADDFQPAGSIGPEIELCFEESAHPFGESFEHEEVVTDRYSTTAIKPAAQPAADRSEAGGPEPQAVEEAVSTVSETPVTAVPAEAELELAAASARASDEDSIELEPKQREAPPVQPPSGPPARRREYRRLFSQLRRG